MTLSTIRFDATGNQIRRKSWSVSPKACNSPMKLGANIDVGDEVWTRTANYGDGAIQIEVWRPGGKDDEKRFQLHYPTVELAMKAGWKV